MKRIGRLFSQGLQFFKTTISQLKPSQVRQAFPDGGRHLYQEKLVDFNIPENAQVLDIGSGPTPFQAATILCDRYIEETVHRRGAIRTRGLPLVVADIHALPFANRTFDFVYCAHIFEHIDDPIKACSEVMRVGRGGYLETPNFMKDMLFCQAAHMNHHWHTIAAGTTLFFFEYTSRQLEGIRSSVWHDLIWSSFYHPLQDVFVENQDLFNTMFLWSNKFDVQVVTKNGEVRRLFER